MSSPSQSLANHENAQLSTGPRTPDGKRASSLNAIRHGLTSQLLALPGEDQAPHEAFRANGLLCAERNAATVRGVQSRDYSSQH